MAQASGSDTYPRPGRVTEVCREWLIHEDGALAYRLQNEEIQQHYTGNKWRNAQVREDIPRARDEQQREMEEAAIVHALHEQMLQRQEEIDAQVAKQLAEKIEHEEWSQKRQAEERDKEVARQLQPSSSLESCDLSEELDIVEDKFFQERERIRLERLREERERVQIIQGADGPMVIPESSPDLSPPPRMQPPLMHHQHMVYQQHSAPIQMAHPYSPKMAVTRTNQMLYSDEDIAAELRSLDLGAAPRRHMGHMHREERNPEFYHTGSSTGEDEPSDYSLNATSGISLEEAKRIQEEQDAELARLLQEQEGRRGGGAIDPLDRDRLMAVEAQDRELAKMLQERERAKARRARERGRQRALLKKQQQREQQMLESGGMNGDDDDDEPEYGTVVSNGTDNEAEDHKRRTSLGQGSPPSTLPPHGSNGSVGRADRPTDLDLSGSRGRRGSTGVKAKPRQRYPDPEAIEVISSVGTADSPSIGSSRCANIAMAIDPTYPRRAHPASPPSPAISSLSRGSSPAVGAVAGIGSGSASSSPGMSLPPPDFEEDDSPAPPYMPIQGQRRTSSLEKKGKKGKQKDGCRQQ